MADIKLKGRDGTETTYTGVATITVPTATGGTVSFGAPVLQALTVTPTAQQQTITPETGYDAFNQVTVNTDANLIPGNIKSGVTIFGVVGTHEGGGNTPTLNAPSITLTDDTLTITNPASNGGFVTGYKIYDGNNLLATVSATSVDLSTYELEDGDHTITVKAAGTYFTDSAASNSVSYTVQSGYTVTFAVYNGNKNVSTTDAYFKLNGIPASSNDYDFYVHGGYDGGAPNVEGSIVPGEREESVADGTEFYGKASTVYVWGSSNYGLVEVNGQSLSYSYNYATATEVVLSGNTTITITADSFDD